jgi:hypothetical protein
MIVMCYVASAILGAIYNHFTLGVLRLTTNFISSSNWQFSAKSDNFMLWVLFAIFH